MSKKIVQTRSTRSRTAEKSRISPVMIGVIAIAAILIVAGLMWLGNRDQTTASAEIDLSQFPSKGPAGAPVTIVEYSDYGCPHCRDYVMNTSDLVIQEYVDTGRVRYVVHSYNLGRPETALAAEAAWCAADQGRFFEYQKMVFENFGAAYNNSTLTDMAGQVEGIDRTAFSECLTSGRHQADVETARRAATRRGVNSTPTFFVNNRRIEGNQPFEVMKSIIDQELSLAR